MQVVGMTTTRKASAERFLKKLGFTEPLKVKGYLGMQGDPGFFTNIDDILVRSNDKELRKMAEGIANEKPEWKVSPETLFKDLKKTQEDEKKQAEAYIDITGKMPRARIVLDEHEADVFTKKLEKMMLLLQKKLKDFYFIENEGAFERKKMKAKKSGLKLNGYVKGETVAYRIEEARK